MSYESMPLYPALTCDRDGGARDGDACVRLPVFGGGMPEGSCRRRVTIENPCRPGETAEVLLDVDACGNLVVCVRRNGPHTCPRPCPPSPCPPRPPRCDGGRGRLYGSWR